LKYLVIFIIALLTGCNSGYEVAPMYGQCNYTQKGYKCHYKGHIYSNNIIIAICDNAKECRDICDNMRKNDN